MSRTIELLKVTGIKCRECINYFYFFVVICKFDSLPLTTPSEIDKYHGEMFDSFMKPVNTAIPKADNRPENKPKISRETLSLIKEKRKLRRLYAKQNDPRTKAEINKLQKDIKNKLNTETNTRWEKFCNSISLEKDPTEIMV